MSTPALRSHLLQALTLRVSPASCQSIQPQLDDYVTAQLAGETYTTRFPLIAAHLDACVACAEAYGLLYGSALAEAHGTLPRLLLQPDLSFLQQRPSATLAEQIQSALQRVGERISLQLSALLVPALRPTLVSATLRGASDSQRYQEKLIELLPDQSWQLTWPVTLTAYRDSQQPANCLLEVMVKPEGWDWPDLEGIVVTVTVAGEQRQAQTDAWGMTAFEAVPTTWLTEMKLEIAL